MLVKVNKTYEKWGFFVINMEEGEVAPALC